MTHTGTEEIQHTYLQTGNPALDHAQDGYLEPRSDTLNITNSARSMDRRDRSTENIALQPSPVHTRGRRGHGNEYSSDVSGQYAEQYEYPPPYYSIPNTNGTGSDEPASGSHEYLDLGPRASSVSKSPNPKAKATAKGGRKCNPCVAIIVAVVLLVLGAAAGGGAVYLLGDKVTENEVSDIKECTSTTCLNGGQCVDGVNGYECQCLPGWTGQKCEKDVNECTSTPCLNGGQCVDGVNEYECQCLPGWSGRICQTDINECASGPCMNGGTCVDVINGYVCQCTSGYKGVYCEQNSCPQYWYFFQENCYRYFSSSYSWSNANNYCRNNGAQLASIHSYVENRFVQGLAGRGNVWTGLSDQATEGLFMWSDGTPVDYTPWKSGEPNNDGFEDCVESLDNPFGMWNDAPCSRVLHFVCKK
ncbi:versican core protein-like isoform X4 [Amphiura filiformis]|uniref:versican core protein-like isoform X4 n=1 Tax=Amphiura filiformis TaxID=82378 RepID=UPI003B21A919